MSETTTPSVTGDGTLPLVVEDGTGIADANGYCTIAFVDEYAAARNYTAWAAYTDEQKSAAIIIASDYWDATQVWYGTKSAYGNGMQWPRVDAYDMDAQMDVPNGIVPRQLQRATAELAIKAAAGTTLLQDLDRGGMVQSESVSGAVSITYMANAPGTMVYGAQKMIAGLVRDTQSLPPLGIGIASTGSPGTTQGMFDIPGLDEGIIENPPYTD